MLGNVYVMSKNARKFLALSAPFQYDHLLSVRGETENPLHSCHWILESYCMTLRRINEKGI